MSDDSRPILVWDLDETLGHFRELYGLWDLSQEVTLKLRPGIKPALQRLADAGFRHHLLTLASPTGAEMVLKATGLRPLFEHVEGMGQRGKGDVEGLCQLYGVPEALSPDRLLFIGDRPFHDCPRHEDVVFHLEIHCLTRPAEHTERLIQKLWELGRQSFRRGFNNLIYERTRWWQFWKKQPFINNDIILREVWPKDTLALMLRHEGCPFIAYKDEPSETAEAESVSFIPAELP